LFTPPAKRPSPDCISYFPPYVGSETNNEEEQQEEQVAPAAAQAKGKNGKEDGSKDEGKDNENGANHSRGSSLSAFAGAILALVRLSPKKLALPLSKVAPDIKPDEESSGEGPFKPAEPVKLVPILTADWPCGSPRDKRQRDDLEEDGENMMLYTVRRQGPRNKDELDPAEVVKGEPEEVCHALYRVICMADILAHIIIKAYRCTIRATYPVQL
jgi:hypothetical protein